MNIISTVVELFIGGLVITLVSVPFGLIRQKFTDIYVANRKIKKDKFNIYELFYCSLVLATLVLQFWLLYKFLNPTHSIIEGLFSLYIIFALMFFGGFKGMVESENKNYDYQQ